MKKLLISALLIAFAFSAAYSASYTYKNKKYSKAYLYKKNFSQYKHKKLKWAIGPTITVYPPVYLHVNTKFQLPHPFSLITNISLQLTSGVFAVYLNPNIVYNFYFYNAKNVIPFIGAGGGIGYISSGGSGAIGAHGQLYGGCEFIVQKNISVFADLALIIPAMAPTIGIGGRFYL